MVLGGARFCTHFTCSQNTASCFSMVRFCTLCVYHFLIKEGEGGKERRGEGGGKRGKDYASLHTSVTQHTL